MSRNPRRQSRKQSLRPKMQASTKPSEKAQAEIRRTVDVILEESGPENLQMVDWLASNGHHISAEGLAVVIEANPGQPLPDGLRNYLCRFLRGKIKRKPGPKTSDAAFKHLIEWTAGQEYRKELRRLQKEARLRGREVIGRGVLTAHEEALKIIKERFRIRFAGVSPRRIANIISSRS